MPKNRFPDSRAKRELRRSIRRRLKRYRANNQIKLGLSYCGMPSVEFLDVREWRSQLRSVCAVELDKDCALDMHIEWNLLQLGIPIRIVKGDILDFLETTNDVFDLYNLDFYGGFVNPGKKGSSRTVDAIKSLIVRQAKKQASFVLVATFNVRDKGAEEYLKLIEDIPSALEGWENVEESCKAHTKPHAYCLKLCFPFFCWQYGVVNNFSVTFDKPVVYRSSATMLNFYAEFTYQQTALPPLTKTDVLVTLANMPLMRIDDSMIETVELLAPQITRNN